MSINFFTKQSSPIVANAFCREKNDGEIQNGEMLSSSSHLYMRRPEPSWLKYKTKAYETTLGPQVASKNTTILPYATPRAAAIAVISLLALTGCAQPPQDPDALAEYNHNHDPAEPSNRKIFAGNKFADDYALKPVAQAYKKYVPDPAQHGIHNFIGNLQEPQIAVNDVLQGNFKRAGNTTMRFAVNTVAGVAGIFDVATDWHLPKHESDFGQTFGVWGIGSGPFVELPLLGPSNVRDSAGSVVSFVTDPFGAVIGVAPLTTIGYVRTGLAIPDGRASILDTTNGLEKNSLDYYATLRSVYAQRRTAMVAEGKNPDAAKIPPTSINPNSIAPVF